MNDDVLHIYAQGAWHGDAAICGTRGALEALRAAIDRALTEGKGECEAFVNDGEGYDIGVRLETSESADKLPLPYVDMETFPKCATGDSVNC
jgi:hypothetical protein